MGSPKPYAEGKRWALYHGDCRGILPSLKVSLLLSDPPYGIAYRGGGGGNLIHSRRHRRSEAIVGDAEPFNPSHLFGFPHVALFGAQHYPQHLPTGGSFHVWDKRGDYREVHTADFDTVWINRKTPGRIYRCVWRGLCRETEAQDPILHPTQKPLIVVAWVMDMFPNGLDVVDPYAGSGTTGVVALRAGRSFAGIEIDERHCETAARRLAQAEADGVQAPLFGAA